MTMFSPTQAASSALTSAGRLASSAASSGSVATPKNYGLSMRFKVTLDGARKSLGDWSSCTGLGVTFNHETYEEGGMYEHVRLLPGRMAYGDVSLERPISSASFQLVQAWLTEVRDKWVYGDATSYQGGSVTITLYGTATESGKVTKVASWVLRNALPVSWSGPTLSADANKVATEKLVLRHEGFLGTAGAA